MSTLIIRSNNNIIYFDTAETVVKNFPNKVTNHPIEDGSPVTDHIVSEPKKITVSGVISDASFFFAADDTFSKVSTLPDGTSKRVPVEGRAQKALDQLEQIRDGREVFTLQTRNEIFEQMVFTSFSVPRDANTGDAARVRFTAQQIETVKRRFVTVPKAKDTDKSSENAETGKQTSSLAKRSIWLESSQQATAFITDLDIEKDIDKIDAKLNKAANFE